MQGQSSSENKSWFSWPAAPEDADSYPEITEPIFAVIPSGAVKVIWGLFCLTARTMNAYTLGVNCQHSQNECLLQGAVGMTATQEIAAGAKWRRPSKSDCTREYIQGVLVADERHSRCIMAEVRLDKGVLCKYLTPDSVQTLEQFASQGQFVITTTMFAMLGGNPDNGRIHPVVRAFQMGELPAARVLGDPDSDAENSNYSYIDISSGGVTATHDTLP